MEDNKHKQKNIGRPQLFPILKITKESPHVKTFLLDYKVLKKEISPQPGQFVMVWVPGDDEIPMSLSYIGEESLIGISVAAVGPTTHKIHQLKEGDFLGIRGPYGTAYSPETDVAIIIGGGIGTASVMSLFRKFVDERRIKGKRRKIIFIEGAKNKEELIYTREIKALLSNYPENIYLIKGEEEKFNSEDLPNQCPEIGVFYCTDDGSTGYHGFTTELTKEIINHYGRIWKEANYKVTLYACGPEKMLVSLYNTITDEYFQFQFSLERMMRCGFGLCGLCALDPEGLLVCKDGPIFNKEQLSRVKDFGSVVRDFSGKPHSLH